jgi:hypothetical protein
MTRSFSAASDLWLYAHSNRRNDTEGTAQIKRELAESYRPSDASLLIIALL